MIRPKTAFKVHFGSNGINTIIHETAIAQWIHAKGVMIDVYEDELDLIRSIPASEITIVNGKLSAKPIAQVVETDPKKVVSALPNFKFSLRDGIVFLVGACFGGILF